MQPENMPAGIADKERRFFDGLARSLDNDKLRMTEDNFDRYRHPHAGPAVTPHEFVYHLLAPLEGKRVLDYGCGDGEHSCLLAACGARVTAFDLSPVSVEKARIRATVNKLQERITAEVREAGRTGYPSRAFDAVVGFGILHHLTMCLPAVLKEIGRVLAQGGAAVFLEPVALSPSLRWVRRLVPLKANATGDERPLNRTDLALLQKHFEKVECWHFRCLTRLTRVLGIRIGSLLRPLDYHAVRLFPFLSRFYGVAVISLRTPVTQGY